MHSMSTCCAVIGTNPKTGNSHRCTVPKGTPHAEHEGWSNWGVWSKDKTGGGVCDPNQVCLNYMWPNQDYRPPKNAPIDYSTWTDEFDCLPDA